MVSCVLCALTQALGLLPALDRHHVCAACSSGFSIHRGEESNTGKWACRRDSADGGDRRAVPGAQDLLPHRRGAGSWQGVLDLHLQDGALCVELWHVWGFTSCAAWRDSMPTARLRLHLPDASKSHNRWECSLICIHTVSMDADGSQCVTVTQNKSCADSARRVTCPEDVADACRRHADKGSGLRRSRLMSTRPKST